MPSRAVTGQLRRQRFSPLAEDDGNVSDRVAAATTLPMQVPSQVVLLDRPGKLHRLVEGGCETPLLVGLHTEVVRCTSHVRGTNEGDSATAHQAAPSSTSSASSFDADVFDRASTSP